MKLFACCGKSLIIPRHEDLAEYEKLRPEYEAICAVIAARLGSNMTQKELAEKTGIRQSNIVLTEQWEKARKPLKILGKTGVMR